MIAFSSFPVAYGHISHRRFVPFGTHRKFPARPHFSPPYFVLRGKKALVSCQINQNSLRSLFPGGYKRPEIKVPGFVLQLSADEVDNSFLDLIDSAVSGRVGIVVLTGSDGRGKRLFEAACLLKSVIRDRAYLLIDERVDIASAVNASGVLLSDQGLPTIVARNALMGVGNDSVVLPLVGRRVETEEAALEACGTEGADFLIINEKDGCSEELACLISERVKIPIFVMPGSLREGMSLHSNDLSPGVSGFVLSVNQLNLSERDSSWTLLHIDEKIEGETPGLWKSETVDLEDGLDGKKKVATFSRLEERAGVLIEKERRILLEAIDVIQRAAPLMEDISLLKDAVSQLDDPFLLVIVGEFNSGKSSFINAFLGDRYLADGVVPTTNEITFLRYSESESGGHRCERLLDGQYTCYIPAPVLKEIVIVDTPGTNVILQRQQRLTEEFLPRADLLFFVMSADRPLTESEVVFLRYSQRWKKKIVFVLNKSDLYRNEEELVEAVSFIKENTQKMLNAENVILYPVSARSALEAKLLGLNDPEQQEQLKNSPYPGANKFNDLEKYLHSFLDSSTSNGIERIKLKLETPVKIAEQILSACLRLAREECQQTEQDLVRVNDVLMSLEEYAMRVENESIAWKRKILSLIDNTLSSAIKVAESSLRLSNVDLVSSYLLSRDKSVQMPASLRFQKEIIDPAVSEVQKLLGEYSQWLQSSSARKGDVYRESFEKRWPAVDVPIQTQMTARELLRSRHEAGLSVIGEFSASAATKLLDQEILEVFLSTYGGLGAAGLSASLLTSVLPTTLEDLLALGLCSAGGFLAISNFPSRRRRTIDKLKRSADALARELEGAMEKDLRESSDSLNKFVTLISQPYREMAEERVKRTVDTLNEIADIQEKLASLQTEIQNLHLPIQQ